MPKEEAPTKKRRKKKKAETEIRLFIVLNKLFSHNYFKN